MTFNASETFTIPQELFGSLVEDMSPSDLPIGASPRNNDIFFLPGGVFTRPALKGLFASIAAGQIMSLSDFRLASGEWNILTLDDAGNLYATDAITGSRTFLFQTPGFCRQHFATYGDFVFIASSGVGPNPNPWATKQSGFDVPAYWNGSSVNRVTSDAPPPTVQAINVAPLGVVPNANTSSFTVSAYATGNPQQSDQGIYYTALVFTCTTTPGSSLVGQWVTLSGLTGSDAAYANISGSISAVNGNTFTVGGSWFFPIAATGQSGTATVGTTPNPTYATRINNYVKAYVSSLFPVASAGFWASFTNSDGSVIDGPTINISTISRDTNGIVTVTIASPWTNLPPGAVVYITPPNASYSGTV